jgi:hypothetical protein
LVLFVPRKPFTPFSYQSFIKEPCKFILNGTE